VDGRQPRALPANGGASLSGACWKSCPPAVLELDARFDVAARSGKNFSRINRDIRFAKDKTPYHLHMYVKFSAPLPGEIEKWALYVRHCR